MSDMLKDKFLDPLSDPTVVGLGFLQMHDNVHLQTDILPEMKVTTDNYFLMHNSDAFISLFRAFIHDLRLKQ